MSGTTQSLSGTDARSLWFEAQALPRRVGSALEAVERAGFIRTLGGVDVYLALRARVKDLTRAQVDRAVAAGELRVVPSVRGCIYLVDREEVPWSLRIADLLSARRREREYDKVEVTRRELDELGEGILSSLASGPLSTRELRKALGDAVRGLGAPGKSVGISSTLPPALRELEFQGRIERALEGGRLDTERYLWRTAASDPWPPGFPDDPAAVHDHLARRFFGAVGVGSVDRFATWAGIGKRDARAAVSRLDGTSVDVDGLGGGYFRLTGAEESGPGGVAFLPFEDNLIQLQDGIATLVDPAYHDLQVPRWGRGKDQTIGTARHMAFRSVAVDGEVVGVWEFDPDDDEVVWAAFGDLGDAVEERVREESAAVGAFLRNDVGRAISFSIDTEDDLRRRCRRIVELASS